eukprot:6196882-Pleurochrysis_carterae.AAC.2
MIQTSAASVCSLHPRPSNFFCPSLGCALLRRTLCEVSRPCAQRNKQMAAYTTTVAEDARFDALARATPAARKGAS